MFERYSCFPLVLRLVLRCSAVLVEADGVSLLTEGLTAEQEVVLPDKAIVTVGDSAGAGLLAVLSGVRAELVRHFGLLKLPVL